MVIDPCLHILLQPWPARSRVYTCTIRANGVFASSFWSKDAARFCIFVKLGMMLSLFPASLPSMLVNVNS